MSRSTVPIALTIAGSDPSGGAGLQADLKTFHQHCVYGTSVVTLLTVQNTERVSRVETMEPSLVREQIEAVFEDVPPSALKTGALGSVEVVRTVAEALHELRSRDVPLVVDPVMISKHGHALLREDAVQACIEVLLPEATLITPNAPEAERLLRAFELERKITTIADAEEAATRLAERLGVGVLLKGGHLDARGSVDVLARSGSPIVRFGGPRIDTPHTHGTGCTYSAAITARLARGEALEPAIRGAKAWLTRAIENGPEVGHGIGPVDHLTPIDD